MVRPVVFFDIEIDRAIYLISKSGLQNLRKTVEVLAAREGLDAHKNAVSIRFKKPL